MSFIATLGKSIVQNVPAILSAASTLGATSMNRKANERLAEKQFAENQKQWMMQNAYNSPSSQVARLKAAGLNPALAYGGTGQLVGNADTTPQLDYAGAMTTPAFGFDSAIQQGLSAQQIKSQIDNTDAQTQLTAAKTLSESYVPDEMKSRISMNMASTDKAYQELDNLRQELMNMSLDQTRKEYENEAARISLEIATETQQAVIDSYTIHNKKEMAEIREIRKKLSVYEAQISEIAANIANTMQMTVLAGSQKNLTEAQASLVRKQTEAANVEIRKLSAEADVSEKNVRWYTFNKVSGLVSDVASVATKGLVGAGLVKNLIPDKRAKIGYR